MQIKWKANFNNNFLFVSRALFCNQDVFQSCLDSFHLIAYNQLILSA